ncbi:MAG: hypothetical protein RL660_1760 [Bacteroidota bacterium]|jgi:predicted ABC-type ATPase
MAENQAWFDFEDLIELAITSKTNFCYETNFNSTPMHWPNLFQAHGYSLHMIFLALNSTDEAKRRVRIRVQNGGHFVADSEVVERYKLGYQNLNGNFEKFQSIDVFDCSEYGSDPRYVMSIRNGKLSGQNKVPDFIVKFLPNVFK